jgi:hypothetical protein
MIAATAITTVTHPPPSISAGEPADSGGVSGASGGATDRPSGAEL